MSSTGAIPKIFVPSKYTLVDDESDNATSISYKLKVKHLCQSCEIDITSAIINGYIKPLQHAVECELCNSRSVRQPYASICSLCSLIKRKCAICMDKYDEFEGSDHPIDVVLCCTMRAMLKNLPYEIKRDPMRKIFRLWKWYKKDTLKIVMDLSLPKKRDGSDSDWEDIDDDIEDVDFKKGRTTYPLNIRHVCDSCENVLNDLISQGELVPLEHANVCPSCNHKSMHQPYYNICSICVRILRKCALCCGDYNVDHIDPRDILLTPCLRNVLDVFPDQYQRKLIRFIFTKWESFLEKKDVKLDEFRTEFMKMSFSFVKEIEIKRKKRDEEKLKLGLKVNKSINEEMKRIKSELNAITAEEMEELRQIEEELNSDLIQSCQKLKCMEVFKTECDKNTSMGESLKMPINKNIQCDKNTLMGESSKTPVYQNTQCDITSIGKTSKMPIYKNIRVDKYKSRGESSKMSIYKNTQYDKNTSMGESSKMPTRITTHFDTYNDENYEEEPQPPEPFEISSDEDLVDWNNSNSSGVPENMTVDKKKTDQSNPDDKHEEGDIKEVAEDEEQKSHLPDYKPEERDNKEVREEDIGQKRHDDKPEGDNKEMQEEDIGQKRHHPDDKPEEVNNKKVQEEDKGQKRHLPDDKPQAKDNTDVQEEDKRQKRQHLDDEPEAEDYIDVLEEDIVQKRQHPDDKPEQRDNIEVKEEDKGQKRPLPEAVDDVSVKAKKRKDFKRVDPIETRRARKKKEYSDFLDEAAMKKLREKRPRKSDPDFTGPGCSRETKKRGRPKGARGRKIN